MSSIYDPIKTASKITDAVIVGFSGGKDSIVTLDLCHRYFKTIHVFFMYQIPGLSFQEAAIRYIENKYGIDVIRIPHFELSHFLRYGVFRKPDFNVGIVKPLDVYTWLRTQTDTWWIAAGERINDSIVRRAMIKQSGSVDEKRGRFYPIAQFTKAEVLAYIKHHKLKVSPESNLLGHSFRSLMPEDLAMIKKHYPADYQKVIRWFPLVEAGVFRNSMQ
jgi:phosphoadenosine phosphosulfate reductase